MGRSKRAAEGGMIYHVLNRANARMPIFEQPSDYEAFEQVLTEAVEREQTRLLAYCLMPNHWHLVIWPRLDGELSRFMGWLTLTHTQRWHTHRGSTGTGHVYQGRFKSFPVQNDHHFHTVSRYVERNPLRANLASRAEQWPWSSLHRWHSGTSKQKQLLAAWPTARRPGWTKHVNEPLSEAELSSVRRSAQRGSPLGDEQWTQRVVKQLGLESTVRPRGRPKKGRNGS